MTKLAGFPMYDIPEIRSATDQFWRALRNQLIARNIGEVPLNLTQPTDLPAFWQDRQLLIGQTCGYPLMLGLCGSARYVATPCYATRFSDGPNHKSVIIANRGAIIKNLQDAKGRVCAINMADSNTGMNLLRLEIAKLGIKAPFFSRVFETHAHRRSMSAVATGEADIAAIDCVTFSLIEREDPDLVRHLQIIQETEESPALPFITSPDTDDATLHSLRDALMTVTRDPYSRPACDQMLLNSISVLPQGAYNRIPDIENRAIALGYPKLA